MRVLLVEDHDQVAQSTIMLLRLLKHDVRHAKCGLEAIAAADEFKPDIMLVDIGLPDITGFEVAQKIREKKEFNNTVLVALTGYDVESQAIQGGFNYYCKKPMDFGKLPFFATGT